MTDESRLVLHDGREPALQAGRYDITVTQHVDRLDLAKPTDAVGTWTALRQLESKQTIVVQAPRWHLSPDMIDRVFPTPAATGDFSDLHPYVMLDHPTLPWERSPHVASVGARLGQPPPDNPDVPWLALFVVPDTIIDDARRPEADAATTLANGRARLSEVATSEFGTDANIARPDPADPRETAQLIDAPDKMLVIDLPRSIVAEEIRITSARLKRHACIAEQQGSAEAHIAGTHALLTCPEPVPAGRCRLLLLSLEGWLEADGRLRDAKSDATHFRFVCLGEWRFDCRPDEKASFTEIAGAASIGLLALPDATGVENTGAVTLMAQGRQGTITKVWRRGPFIAARLALPAHAPDPLKIRGADGLILDPDDGGQPDVSYAEAWEKGRICALRNPQLAGALAECRRACQHHNTGLAQLCCEGDDHPPMPTAWLRSLTLLEPLPYRNLVPVEALLGPEQLRFFLVDDFWVRCFVAGAVSLGRPFASEQSHHRETMLADAVCGIAERPVSGMLLRSAAVARWPSLLVTGAGPDRTLEPLRQTRLDNDVLLVLFGGEIDAVTISPPPHHLHIARQDSPETKAAQWAAARARHSEKVTFALR